MPPSPSRWPSSRRARSRPPDPIALAPCEADGAAARCGTLTVFENRAARTGRTIDLNCHQPVPYATESQKALDGIFADCEADAGCATAFPNLREESAAILAKVTEGPVRAGAVMEGGAAHPLALSRGAFAETVRYMLYTPSDAARLPAHVHAALEGDFLPFARQLLLRRRGYTSVFDAI